MLKTHLDLARTCAHKISMQIRKLESVLKIAQLCQDFISKRILEHVFHNVQPNQ
jgi:hypothetical protein